MNIKEERALIDAAQHGNEQAFGKLYDAHVDRVYRYIYYRVSTPEIAQDLTSEVFLRVVEGLPGYQHRELPFMAWLYRIAHARVVDHYRQSVRSKNDQDLEEVKVGIEIDLDTDLMANYHQEIVRDALTHLTEEQQQVIMLRFVEGHTLQQAADLMGKSIGAVKVMQFRALQALYRVLARKGLSEE